MSLQDFGLVPHDCKTVKPGDRFGRLLILATGKSPGTYRYRAVYRCDCGTVSATMMSSIQRGESKSCGCLIREKSTKHGAHSSPVYRAWAHMMRRCYNPIDSKFHHYGGRGIKVADEWHSLDRFMQDMAASYIDGYMLERIDNEKGYSPQNCKWASRHDQQRNRRNNIRITMNGRTQVLQDWCNELGVNYQLAWERIKVRGWEPVRALTTPPRPIKRKPD